MGIIQRLTATAFVYSVALFVASLAFGRLCLSILLHPTRSFWRVKRRRTAPDCLTDPAYGIHGYLPIEVGNASYCSAGDHSKWILMFILACLLCIFFLVDEYIKCILIVVILQLGGF